MVLYYQRQQFDKEVTGIVECILGINYHVITAFWYLFHVELIRVVPRRHISTCLFAGYAYFCVVTVLSDNQTRFT